MAGVVTSSDWDFGYLSVEITLNEEQPALHLKGELDLGSAQLVSDALVQVEAGSPPKILVDLSDVTFMDCSGLSVLVGAYNRACRDDRELVIRNPQPSVRRIFNLTGCKHLLSELPDPERETLKA